MIEDTEMKTRIEIVEDNDVVRDGLQLLINSMSNHVVVGAYISCEQALKNLDKDMPDVILMAQTLLSVIQTRGMWTFFVIC